MMQQSKLPTHVLFPLERPLKCENFLLQAVVHEVTDVMAGRLLKRKIKTMIEIKDGFVMHGDRDLLYQALLHMSQNAVEAMPAGGELTFSASSHSGGMEIRVTDTGPGMSDEVRAHAFEPYFTTKRHATGLGLAVVRRVAERHEGEAVATSATHGGTVLTIRIPRQTGKAAA